MPRLKAMLERGEGRNLRPEKSTRQQQMSFGMYFNGLIESGQVERFDKDMQKAFDVGDAEIKRQGDRGNGVNSEQTALRAKLAEMVEAGKITREEAVKLFETAFPERGRRGR